MESLIYFCLFLIGVLFHWVVFSFLFEKFTPERKPLFLGTFALVEAGMALVLFFCHKSTPLMLVEGCCLLALLYACAYSDLRGHLILNKVLLAGLAVRLLFLGMSLLFLDLSEFRFVLLSSLVSAVLLGGSMLLCHLLKPQGIGFGDVKLLFVYGLFLGTNKSIEFMVYTFLGMFVVCVFLLLTKRATGKTTVPFAPFLLVGTLFGIFFTGL